MSSLSKVTIEKVDKKAMQLRIERIHPDALTLKWLHTQNQEALKRIVLFRIMVLLETNEMKDSDLYQAIFLLLQPICEEETIDIDADFDLTENGDWILKEMVHQIIVEAVIIEEDLNDNWEKGLLKNLNPYKTEGMAVPYVKFNVVFQKELLQNSLVGLVDYSAMSISCGYN